MRNNNVYAHSTLEDTVYAHNGACAAGATHHAKYASKSEHVYGTDSINRIWIFFHFAVILLVLRDFSK